MSNDDSRSAIVLHLAEEFIERHRKGERPSLREYLDKYPDLAGEIREVFPALAVMENIALPDESHAVAVRDGEKDRSLPLQQLGDYRIIREIGRGGMGVVYEAEQVSLGRHVALKVLPQTALADATHKARFEREAKAAAKLHHTNIVPVFGVGEHEGLPYYVMQFIQGLGIDEVLDELVTMRQSRAAAAAGSVHVTRPAANELARSLIVGQFGLSTDSVSSDAASRHAGAFAPDAALHAPKVATGSRGRLSDTIALSSSSLVLSGADTASSSRTRGRAYAHSVARIGLQVAQALDYAHSQGVVHRDIKPSNLLLDTRGTVWVTDFGLAKANDQQQLTAAGDILGTIRYMPPEAFEGKSDARGDIYALGLTLYEMLTLKPAFVGKDRNRLIKRVTTEEPARLDSLDPALPRDLITIIHKAIDRDPTHRYATAGEMAADLHRFLNDEPIKARPLSSRERLSRWARRHPGLAVSLTVIGVLLASVALISVLVATRLGELAQQNAHLAGQREGERLKAVEAQQAAEQAGDEARRRGDSERWERYRSNMAAAVSALQLQNVGAARRALDAAPMEHRNWEWLHFHNQLDGSRLVLRGHEDKVWSVALSPDGARVASSADDGTIRLWDAVFGRELKVLRGHQGRVRSVAFSPDGRRLASGGADLTVRLWNADSGAALAVLRGHQKDVQGIVLFSPDGTRLVSCGQDDAVWLWNGVNGERLAVLKGHDKPCLAAVFSPDSRWLATGGDDGAVRLWDAATGAEKRVFRGHTEGIRSLAFSPDGTQLVSGSRYPDNAARLWKVETGELLAVLIGHANQIVSIAFSPDGSRIASASWDQTVRLWNAKTGKELHTLFGHMGWVHELAFSPDGKRLVSACEDQTLRLWDVEHGLLLSVLRGHTGPIWSVKFSADGKVLASASHDRTIRLWEVELVERQDVLRGHTSFVYDVAFSRDGKQVASSGWDGAVRFWDATTGRQRSVLRHEEKIVLSLAFYPEGDRLASLARDNAVHLWDLASGKQIQQLEVPTQYYKDTRVAISPKGSLLAAGGQDGHVRIWNVTTGEPAGLLRGHNDVARDVAFSPDGRSLASVGEDAALRIWDLTKKQLVHVLTGHTDVAYAVAYNGDGRLVASGSFDETARIWDARSGTLVAVLAHPGKVFDVAFSPDGTRLATGCGDNTIRLWDLATYKEVAELRGHTAYVHAVAWSSDGTRLASASGDATVRVWDTVLPAVRARPAEAYIAPKGYVCYRTAQAGASGNDEVIQIDGKLNEAVWNTAPWTDDFVDIEGELRIKPRFRTRAKMLWDDRYFYIAAELEEPHLQASFTKHDSYIFHEDNDFEVFIDPDGDNHNYAEFEMNALNTGWDLRLSMPYRDGGKAHDDWNIKGLKTAVHTDGTLNDPRDTDRGWTLEIAIPWEEIRKLQTRPISPPSTPLRAGEGSGGMRLEAPKDGEQWRVNFSRVQWRFSVIEGKYRKVPHRKEDNWVWSPQGTVNMHRPETWGYVQFSTAPPGKGRFRPDLAGPGKHLLHHIYEAQWQHQHRHKRYATTLEELNLVNLTHESVAGPPMLEARADAFGAWVDVKLPDGRVQRWKIRQDSLVESEPPRKE